MQKFIKHAISHLEAIFPSIYESRPNRGSFHAAFGYSKNRLLAVGLNSPDKVNAKAFHFARKFNLQSKLMWPYVHAEESLIGKLIGMDKLNPNLNIVILRLNRFGELKNSFPCESCRTILAAYSLDKIFYSDSSGEILSF